MALTSRGRKRVIWGSVALIVLAAVAVAALVVTARPEFCATCHLMKTRYVSWERSDHAMQADCMDCHSEPGWWGEIKAHVNGARYLYVLVTGRPQVILRAEVPEGSCIECHPVERLADDAEGVNVAHRLHYSADVPCETCHRGFHSDIGGGTLAASTDVCTECHSGLILTGRERDEDEASGQREGWSVDGVR